MEYNVETDSLLPTAGEITKKVLAIDCCKEHNCPQPECAQNGILQELNIPQTDEGSAMHLDFRIILTMVIEDPSARAIVASTHFSMEGLSDGILRTSGIPNKCLDKLVSMMEESGFSADVHKDVYVSDVNFKASEAEGDWRDQ